MRKKNVLFLKLHFIMYNLVDKLTNYDLLIIVRKKHNNTRIITRQEILLLIFFLKITSFKKLKLGSCYYNFLH